MSTFLWVLLGIFCLVFAFAGVILTRSDGDIGIGGFIGGALLGVILYGIFFTVVVLPCTYWIGQRDQVQEFPLVSAQDTTGVKGSFVWGSGSVSSGLVLNYYVKYGDAIVPRGTKGKPTRIYEVHGGPYRVVERYSQCTWWVCLDDTDDWTFELYVPPNSVVSNFAMDAK